MLRKTILWILAFIITLGSAVYQRLTGPTHPIDNTAAFAGNNIIYHFARSHGGPGDQPVFVIAPDTSISAILHYKRYKIDEKFHTDTMKRYGDTLAAYLPHQPPAGKLEYYVDLAEGDLNISLPGQRTVVIRFTGDVPISILLSHAILMFVAMFLSLRTSLEALYHKGKTRNLTIATFITLLFGGMILGPVVQKFAFGALWTGIPFGWDLTDNKTLIAFIFWSIALVRHRFNPQPRYWVLAAALMLFAIFMIPHSMMGSELDYSTGEVTTG